MTDHELMRDLSAGKRAALAELYKRHAGCLLAIGKRILGKRTDAETLLTALFVDLWRKPTLLSAHPAPLTALIFEMRTRALSKRGVPVSVIDTTVDDRGLLEMCFFDGHGLNDLAARLAQPAPLISQRLALALTRLHASGEDRS